MNFTAQTWQRSADVYQAITQMPFVKALGDGTLDRHLFEFYMTQDALYLAEYGRVLAGVAALSGDAEACQFWAASAVTAVVAERELHTQFVDVGAGGQMSPTCRAYTNHLLASLSSGSYAVAASAVLPCFWIYMEVGKELFQRAAASSGGESFDDHPYAEWIRMYADTEFERSVEQAKAYVDEAARRVGADERERMHEAYVTSARYEWMFWDSAWRQEQWPI